AIIEKHHAAQRLLRRCVVKIPFARRLAELFPNKRTDARRSFGHLLSFIEAVALLHQYQRIEEPHDCAVIEATKQDYAIARDLLAKPFVQSLGGGVSEAARRFCERLYKRFINGQQFNIRDVAKGETIIGDLSTIRAYCKALAHDGLLELVEPG